MSIAASYNFEITDIPDLIFDVIEFEGEECLSNIFTYSIIIRSSSLTFDSTAHLAGSATLTIQQGDLVRYVTGLIEQIELLNRQHEFFYYSIKLVSPLWRLTQDRRSQVYLNKDVLTILDDLLANSQFPTEHYEIDRTQMKSYRTWAFRCQYEESNFDYMSRILEREGIYYYHDFSDKLPKIVFIDQSTQQAQRVSQRLLYVDTDGESLLQQTRSVCSFKESLKPVPATIVLRDYNDETPSVAVRGVADVESKGVGTIDVFGLNVLNIDEGNTLAAIRAEEIISSHRRYHCTTTVTQLAPGYIVELDRHFKDTLNQEYTVVSVIHKGFNATLSQTSHQFRWGINYENTSIWIAKSHQFRPPLKTRRPHISGTLHAKVDAAGAGENAQLDSQGRYKIILPFDDQVSTNGAPSAPVRMLQSLGGEQEGAHFPLRKGARVLLAFIDGDPDRPIIAGAIPSAEQPSTVNGSNQNLPKIKTCRGNEIEFSDNSGQERIKFSTPYNRSYLHLGYPDETGDGITLLTQGMFRLEALSGERSTLLTNEYSTGNISTTTGFDSYDERDHVWVFSHIQKTNTENNKEGCLLADISESEEDSGDYIFERRQGQHFHYSDGDNFSIANGKDYNFGTCYVINVVKGPSQSGNKFTYNKAAVNSFINNHAGKGSSARFTKDEEVGGNYPGWFGLTLNSGSALVEKTYGDSYSYTSGDVLEKYCGSNQQFYEAAQSCIFWGAANEFHFGYATEFFMGAKTEANIGGILEFNAAVRTQISVTLDFSFAFGRKQIDTDRMSLSPSVKKVQAQDFDASLQSSKVRARDMEATGDVLRCHAKKISAQGQTIEANSQKIAAQGQEIKSNATAIEATNNRINSINLQLFNAMTEIRSAQTQIARSNARIDQTQADLRFTSFCAML